MKKSLAVLSLAFDARRSNLPQTIAIVIGVSVVVGMLMTDTADDMIAYLSVSVACAAPIALWIQFGAAGIPVMPAISALFFVYYALPILRKNADISDFGSPEILSAAVTVTLFLGTATLSWWPLVAGSAHRSCGGPSASISGSQLEKIIFLGLALGVLYHLILFTGWLDGLGPALGLVRGVMLSAAEAACFMLGNARAQGLLRRQKWFLAMAALCALVVLAWATLFLVIGLSFCLAALFGYVITSRRLPWVALSIVAAVVIVLHAGKDEMRNKYWLNNSNYGAAISPTEVPARIAEWVDVGIGTIGSDKSYRSAVDRASLLTLLMRVQRLAGDYAPFLNGQTYALLPQMLVPRFLDPDKIQSQAGMYLLNVHFGIQTVEDTRKTSIGWGLIAEAYANFGRLGVIGVALVFGLLCGSLERWSVGAAIISLPSLIAVVAMMVMANVELDAAALLTTLFQSLVAIATVFWSLKTLSTQRKPRLQPVGQHVNARLVVKV